MRAHNVIIVSSGKSDIAPPDALDRVIRSVFEMKKKPILVVGPDGDDFLRSCTEIEKCELVFDPNFEGGFFSGVKAGLFATVGAAVVVPLHAAGDDFQMVVSKLEDSVPGDGTEASCDVVCPLTHEGAPARKDAVFLVTQKGVKALKNIPASTDWETCNDVLVQAVPLSFDR